MKEKHEKHEIGLIIKMTIKPISVGLLLTAACGLSASPIVSLLVR